MRILILRSRRRDGGDDPEGPYTQQFRSRFAEKVVANLQGDRGLCARCGPECNDCREGYGRRFGECIAGVVDLPAVLPHLLEDPGRHLPADVPRHEILIAVNIHEQVLVEAVRRCRRWGTRGVVAPLEAPDWVSGSARAEAESAAAGAGVEIALPKPFCDFDPPAGTVLADFRRRFHIGRPEVELTVRNGKVERAHVHVSAACGATYYVARWLEGRRVDDDLKYDIVAKRLHSYPCTASMKWDDDLGDTVMHVAGQAHYAILDPLGQQDHAPPEMVRSPVAGFIPKPPRPRETTRNIDQAKRAILADLDAGGEVTIEGLRTRSGITPAAAYSALLILEQEGKVRSENGRIVKA